MESQRKNYGKALVELGKRRKDIVVLDADLSGSTRTVEFKTAYRNASSTAASPSRT
jgi:transketolase